MTTVMKRLPRDRNDKKTKKNCLPVDSLGARYDYCYYVWLSPKPDVRLTTHKARFTYWRVAARSTPHRFGCVRTRARARVLPTRVRLPRERCLSRSRVQTCARARATLLPRRQKSGSENTDDKNTFCAQSSVMIIK